MQSGVFFFHSQGVGCMRIHLLGLMATGLLISTAGFAKGEAEWKENANAYKNKHAVPVKTIAVGAVNVDVGVHLERLTLLSGEGHTGKKVFSGLLAGAATIAGVGGGVDFASREPLEEHLTPEDAKKIASEVAQVVSERFKKMEGFKVLAGEEVTSAAFYAGLGGSNEQDTGKKRVQDGRWSPEYYFGYYSTPAGGYRYHPLSKFSFGDKTFSPVIRQNLAADATVRVDVFLVNTRKDFRIQEMNVSLNGLQWEGQKNGDLPTLMYALNNAGELSVPVESKSKDNYAAWQAMKPQFEAKLDALVAKIQTTLPPVAASAAPVMSASPDVAPKLEPATQAVMTPTTTSAAATPVVDTNSPPEQAAETPVPEISGSADDK